MLLAILAVVGLAWWLHRDGVLMPNLQRFGGVAVAGLLAFRLFSTGRPLLALAVAAIGYGWWKWSAGGMALPSGNRRLAEAARLLNVPADAGSDVIWQAWRSAMARAHPDAGGSDEAAQALTAARDLLIAAAQKRNETGR